MSRTLAFFDIALTYDPALRRGDLVLGEDGDLALDATAATPMVISLGSDRRSRPDDVLPTGIDALNDSSSLLTRRGWVGDALDHRRRRIGSRLWLLDRAKHTENTRMLCEEWTKEAFTWASDETGEPADIVVQWPRKGVLVVVVYVGGTEIRRVLREAA